ncbi:Ig-like domain-containing protein, partial [Microbulbifer sp.]|uniref:Ig-like domain-containing protein n=1 Tax=Microbulbifer sp. TaxID=1908541 RepID=UPI002F953E11
NTIEVSGEHIMATVNGHTAGSTFDITPEANFSGETEVTVTVRDNNVSSDASSVKFKLMVNAMDDAPIAAVAGDVTIKEGESATLDASTSSDADGDALTFSWSGPGTISGADTAKPTISGLSAGKHEFTVTVSDGVNSAEAKVTVTVDGKKKKGGSVYYLLALLAAAGLFRRRKLA